MPNPPFKISDPVSFYFENSLQKGFIASIHRGNAIVVVNGGEEYRAPVSLLKLRQGVSPKRVYTKNRLKRLEFSVGDQVYFIHKDKGEIIGTIRCMNPKRAKVDCRDATWDVSYENLFCVHRNERAKQYLDRLESISQLADKLLTTHELDDWRFSFDDATKRGGLCSGSNKVISMSEQFCLKADDEEIKDTILHEIAHALVGVEQGHNEVWRKKALEIGCSGKRTHNSSFTTPKYIMSCMLCGWQQPRQKRLRNLICSRCKKPVQFKPYSEAVHPQ